MTDVRRIVGMVVVATAMLCRRALAGTAIAHVDRMATPYHMPSAPSLPPRVERVPNDNDWSLLPTVHRREIRPRGIGIIWALLAIPVALILAVLASSGAH